jgi:hypothetical protein
MHAVEKMEEEKMEAEKKGAEKREAEKIEVEKMPSRGGFGHWRENCF